MSACSSLLKKTRPGLGADGAEAGPAGAELSLGAIVFGEDFAEWRLNSDETDDEVVAPDVEEEDEEEVIWGEGETDMYWTRFLGLDFALRFLLQEMHCKCKISFYELRESKIESILVKRQIMTNK